MVNETQPTCRHYQDEDQSCISGARKCPRAVVEKTDIGIKMQCDLLNLPLKFGTHFDKYPKGALEGTSIPSTEELLIAAGMAPRRKIR